MFDFVFVFASSFVHVFHFCFRLFVSVMFHGIFHGKSVSSQVLCCLFSLNSLVLLSVLSKHKAVCVRFCVSVFPFRAS